MSELAAATLDARTCTQCAGAIDSYETRTVDQRPLCTRCADALAAALAAEKRLDGRLPMALAAGLTGAMLGAGIWAAVAVFARREVGVVALLVGWLAGAGVKRGAGKARGTFLQLGAAALSLVGLVTAKYFTFAHFFAEKVRIEQGISLGPFDPSILAAFPVAFHATFSIFDVLWALLAARAAWKGPAPSKVSLQRT